MSAKKFWVVLAMACLIATPAWPNDQVRQGGRETVQGFKKMGTETGRAIKEGGREVGRGFKKMGEGAGQTVKKKGREAGQEVKKAGRTAGRKVTKAGRSIGDWCRDAYAGTMKHLDRLGKNIRGYFQGK
ncbi:MAG TPA: hypothetical protein PK425_03910 [Syntrophales bacterium]|nr:hypothetical protein [Syntrophales bacterium]